MTAIIRSLIPLEQTLDSVALPAWGTQTRAASTAALVAAVAAKTIQMDIVADTGSPDAAAQTVYVYTPLTGVTQAIPEDAEVVHVDPAGTIAALTLTMPVAPYDGQEVVITFDQIVTSLTLTATPNTIKGALTAGTAKGFGRWRYRTANTTWYRVG